MLLAPACTPQAPCSIGVGFTVRLFVGALALTHFRALAISSPVFSLFFLVLIVIVQCILTLSENISFLPSDSACCRTLLTVGLLPFVERALCTGRTTILARSAHPQI